VLGRDRHVGDAPQRVRPGGEHFQHLALDPFQREADLGAHRASDPLPLHGLDRLRPVHQVEVVHQTIGVGGDARSIHCERPAHAREVPALRAAVDHLLVGEDRLQLLAPPDRDLGLVHEPQVEESGEDPLRPAVVARVGGAELPVPVEGETDQSQLAPEVVDVLARGFGRVLAGRDRVLLGGETEGVPAHGVEDVASLHPLPPRHDVAADVAHGVAHVQPRPGGVGEHVEHVVLGARRVEAGIVRVLGGEGLVRQPALLPARLERTRIVGVAHDDLLY
jgi:hypothetical protein